MPGYKVRLADGSEIGPLDLEMVRSWYSQGLIHEDSPVLPAGSRKWGRLADVLPGDIRPRKFTGPQQKAPLPSFEPEEEAELYEDDGETPLWRSILACVFFFAATVGAAVLYFAPYRWRPELSPAPWREIALGCLLIALFLVRGVDSGRKLARIAVGILGFAVFPLIAVLFVRGVRNDAYLVLLGLWFVATGFFFFLAQGRLPLRTMILSLLAVTAGATGIVRFGVRADDRVAAEVREWAAEGRLFEDFPTGIKLALPGTWVMLKEGNPLVPMPPPAKVSLADPSQRAFGFLQAEEPQGVLSLDRYVDRIQAARRAAGPGLAELSRATVPLGERSARRTVSTRETEMGPVREVVTAWKDGWSYVTFVVWSAAGEGATEVDVDTLLAGYTVNPAMTAQLQSAITAVTAEVPHLSGSAAELLMGQSAAHVLEPDDTFRRAHALASRGLALLPPAEVKEVGQIMTATYATLPARDRTRLAAYLDRVAARMSTTAADDKEMKELLKAAVLKLPPERRLRLQVLYEKAILAGIPLA